MIRKFRTLVAVSLCVSLVFGGCSIFRPNQSVELSSLKGWQQDSLAQTWAAWRLSCESNKLPTSANWKTVCDAAAQLQEPGTTQIREYFEQHFVASPARDAETGKKHGLITGYFEPVLRGNRVATQTYRWPIYRVPENLLTIDLSDVYPQLENKRVRGRMQGRKVVPYADREAIDGDAQPLAGDELLWLDDPVDVFFLHVQGSGRVELPDGSFIKVGYADQNGHRYVSIGRTLVDLDALELKDVSLQSIRQWLEKNPDEMQEVLNSNPSYVFFDIKQDPHDTPSGALGVPLTPERSIAVDKLHIPLGAPVWLDTDLPQQVDVDQPESYKKPGKPKKKRYRRLTFAQDTGGAIKGAVRADMFWGRGPRAELIAGHMKQKGRLWVLEPRNETDAN